MFDRQMMRNYSFQNLHKRIAQENRPMGKTISKSMLFLTTTCLAMGVMVSPLSMPILGNSAGALGKGVLWSLPAFALLNFLTVNRHFSAAQAAVPKHPTMPWSEPVLSVLRLSALLPFCIGSATLILAAAGYTFNETFARWFPNLLFSVCFLIFILAMNLIGRGISRHIQNIAVIVFSGAIVVLVAMGLFSIDRPIFEGAEASGFSSFKARPFFMLFWLFMAAELAAWHEQKNNSRRMPRYAMPAAFGAALVLFWCWSMISIAFAPLDALAKSTVPQTIAAHMIAGITGRQILGIAILAGSFAAVNTLLLGTSAVLHESLSPMKKHFQRYVTILSLLILCMLLTGMAGKEITFSMNRSAFYIWLAAYAGYNFFPSARPSAANTSIVAGLALSAIYLAAFVVLVATDPDRAEVASFIVGFTVLFAIVSIAGRYLAKN